MAELDRNAATVAAEAFLLMDDHPKGYSLTASQRLRRALFAYEWAKEVIVDHGDEATMPSLNATRNAVIEWESRA